MSAYAKDSRVVVEGDGFAAAAGDLGGDVMEKNPIGYIVLLREPFDGPWRDNWDGVVHGSLSTGKQALKDARDAGFEAVLTAAMPVGDTS